MPGPLEPASDYALDDAGKPLPLIPPHLKDDAARLARPPLSTWLYQRFFPLIALACFAFSIYRDGVSSHDLVFVLALGATFGLAGLVAANLAARFARKRGTPLTLPLGIAWTAAHRHCGCCAYSLHEIPPDTRGLATCPECGAAWHRDRWTLAHRPLRPSTEQRLARRDPSVVSDDRGVQLDVPPRFPPSWISQPESLKAVRPIVEANQRARTKRVRIAAPIFLLSWPALTALVVWTDAPMPRDLAFDIVFMGIIIGLIHAPIAWLLWLTGPGWKSQRASILAVGLCPSCGSKLPAGAPGFDGCTACPSCARAWRTPADHS